MPLKGIAGGNRARERKTGLTKLKLNAGDRLNNLTRMAALTTMAAKANGRSARLPALAVKVPRELCPAALAGAELMPIENMRPPPRNSRKHSARQIEPVLRLDCRAQRGEGRYRRRGGRVPRRRSADAAHCTARVCNYEHLASFRCGAKVWKQLEQSQRNTSVVLALRD